MDHSSWELVVVDNKSEDIGYRISDIVRDRLGLAPSNLPPPIQGSASRGEESPLSRGNSGVKGLRGLGSSKAEKTPSAISDLPSTPSVRVVREDKLGLTHARVRGFQEAQGEIVVMVDDDNVLKPDYLERAIKILGKNPQLGAIGGKALPEFEIEPPEWLKGRSSGLGLRDLGEGSIIYPESRNQRSEAGSQRSEGRQNKAESENRKAETGRVRRMVTEFPECAPIGAGMVIRREAALEYVEDLKRRDTVVTDRKGKSLASGGDNDICLTALEHGWGVGYFPELELTHLIPKERMTLKYQRRMARDAMRSFVVMLDQHGIRPWESIPRWSLPLRVAKDFLRVRAWQGPQKSLTWFMHLGRYEACATLAQNR